MKTTKVSRTFTARYDILSDVMVSPTRLEILNKLFDSPDEVLSYDELVKQMSEKAGLQRHLKVLLEDNIIEERNGKYALSKNGLDAYHTLGKVALKVKELGLLTTDTTSNT